MHYFLMPLNQHSDNGLGVTGDAFEETAKFLKDNLKAISGGHVHLPISFIYRHAIELYLKSIITVLHKGLKLPYGDEPHDGQVMVPMKGMWKPIYAVHSIAILWAHVFDIIRSSKTELEDRCRTNWQDIPDDFLTSIAEIDR